MRGRIVAAVCAALLGATARAGSFADAVRARTFLKGNLHAHSDRSDGDAPPEAVLAWYASHGYAFAAVTDHDVLTAASAPGIVALRGVEISSRYGPAGRRRPVHVNALCADRAAAGANTDASSLTVLNEALSSAAAAGARLIVVNHPTWTGALSASELVLARDYGAIEIASGHPDVVHDDDAPRNAESLWDAALDAGRAAYAVAADDAHDFDGTIKNGETALREPGKAWVSAWADATDAGALCDALARGHFYASTGAELSALDVQDGVMTVAVARWGPEDAVEFVVGGAGGRRTIRSSANPARYELRGGETWVRARVLQPRGKAWTQAYRVKTTAP